MKKIAYMIAALPLALFAKSASADISVSGTGSIAYVDAGGNTSSTYGGGVSFDMSTVTDGGITVTGSAAISNDNDSVNSDSAVTGITALSFGFANGSITIGEDIGVADGVGLVGELAHYNEAENQTSITNKPGITDDEGDGIAASTTIGDMSLAVAYVWDGGKTGDVDGASNTAQSVSLSMPVGAGTLTIANASDDVSGTNMTETAAAYTMPVSGGTLSLGFTGTDGDTASLEGESVSVAYKTTLGGVELGIGYTGHDANSKTAQQTDITLSSALGGGVSVFAEYSNVSGTVATETATLSNNVVAIGTSVSF